MKVHHGSRPGRFGMGGGARLGRADVLAVLGLVVAAAVTRRNVLPHGGLYPDEAWQAFGAAKGSPSNILTVGFSAPGFTGALMVWHRLAGSPEQMADLPLAAGIITPALAYVALRRFGSAWSISLLLGAALVSQRLNVVYSGRVKSYVIDALIVLAFAALLPRLVRVHFNWRAATLWVIGSFAVGFFSPFALIASAVAGVILLLRPAGDRAWRLAAVAVQAILFAVLTVSVRRTYDVKALQSWWKHNYDGFVGFDAQPLRFVSDVATHLRRVASVFSGGPAWWATLTLVLVIAALGIDAFVRRASSRAVRAQYLLVVVLVAVAASVVGALPLGPISVGMRLSLWLVPVFVIGGARVLDRLRAPLAGHGVTRIAFDATAVIVAGLLVANASIGRTANHFTQVRSAASYVERTLTSNDVLLIDHTAAMFSYAVASRLDVRVRPRHSLVAFEPDFRDPRVHYFDFAGPRGKKVVLTAISPAHATDVARAIGRADRVYVYIQVFPDAQRRGRFSLGIVMHTLGYTKESDTRFNFAQVVVWKRAVP